MSTNKLSLRLDEENSLKFKMNIQGTTSEPGASKPQVRLIIVEKDNPQGMGLVFPVQSQDGDTITFKVPTLSGVVRVGATYSGKVEVIIGSRIFAPISMDIVFTKNLSVEIAPVKEEKEVPRDVTDILTEIESLDGSREVFAQTTPQKKSQVTLTKSQLEQMLKERLHNRQKAAPAKPAGNSLKDSLKGMMKDALKED